MISLLSERLHYYETRMEDVTLKGVPGRLASLSLLLVESEGVKVPGETRIPTRYTHEHLGTMIGANREAVTRAFGRLQDEHALQIRRRILLEAAANYSQAYYGIRTVSTNGITRRKYVEYAGGARELNNLESDAYELANKYSATSPPTGLASRLKVLKSCGAEAAVTCRVAENRLQ